MLGSFSDTRGSVSDFLLYITAKKKGAKSVMRSERSMVSIVILNYSQAVQVDSMTSEAVMKLHLEE